jgi:F420H(2)-dependent biliverdin reductase
MTSERVRATSFDLADPSPDLLAFLTERHLGTLGVVRPNARVHMSPVGFTVDPELCTARVITSATARKAVHAAAAGRITLCQVDGGRWVTVEGACRVSDDPAEVRDAEARYAARYQTPRPNPNRVALLVTIDRIYGRV